MHDSGGAGEDGGGAAAAMAPGPANNRNGNPIFYIYITGIYNYGRTNNMQHLRVKFETLSIWENLISQIPDYFNINIVYYDKFDDEQDCSAAHRRNIRYLGTGEDYMRSIFQNLKKSPEVSGKHKLCDNPRVTKIDFVFDYFEASLINDQNQNHIIIDFANIFTLDLENEHKASIITKSENGRTILSTTTHSNIHILRVSPWGPYGYSILEHSKLIDVSEQHIIRTFYDQLLRIDTTETKEYIKKVSTLTTSTLMEPMNVIDEIHKKIITSVENEFFGGSIGMGYDTVTGIVHHNQQRSQLVEPSFRGTLHVKIVNTIWEVENIDSCIYSLTQQGIDHSYPYILFRCKLHKPTSTSKKIYTHLLQKYKTRYYL